MNTHATPARLDRAAGPSWWRIVLGVVAGVGLLPALAPAAEKGRADHVLVVVWDGMRPDFITAEHTPTLHQLAQQATVFQNHHAVYVSSTEVNGVTLNTGAYPQRSGIVANREYRPEIDRLKSLATEDVSGVRQGDGLSGGRFVAMPTLAEIVQRAGFHTAVAGTKSVTFLFDRAPQRTSAAASRSANFFKGGILPDSALPMLIDANGGRPFPTNITYPNVAQDQWTTTALTHGMWKDDLPKFSVLWLSDPDYTQHDSGPGSPAALRALESVDRNLASVLKTLEERKLRDQTDLFIVSDHGFSTVERAVDVAAALRQSGFSASRTLSNPQPGDVLVVTLGGSVSLYVIGHEGEVIRKLVAFLQACDFAGVIFSRTRMEGTFPLEQVRIDTRHAPDLMVSLRWNAGANTFGTPGMLIADTNKKGMHGSLSRFDMSNTLVAAGPDFRRGFKDEWPTGNADLAPTILWILGIEPPQPMDGRILGEAMVDLEAPASKSVQTTIEASHDGEHFHWRQYLKISKVGEAVYFDEGNGGN